MKKRGVRREGGREDECARDTRGEATECIAQLSARACDSPPGRGSAAGYEAIDPALQGHSAPADLGASSCCLFCSLSLSLPLLPSFSFLHFLALQCLESKSAPEHFCRRASLVSGRLSRFIFVTVLNLNDYFELFLYD